MADPRDSGDRAHLLSVCGHHTLCSAQSECDVAERGFDPQTFGLWAQHANLCATPLWFNVEQRRPSGIGAVASILRLGHYTHFPCTVDVRLWQIREILETGHTYCLCVDTTLFAWPKKNVV